MENQKVANPLPGETQKELNRILEDETADYAERIERLCRVEKFTLAHLVENIASILPQYETAGEKSSCGKRSHTSVRQALRRFKMFLASEISA